MALVSNYVNVCVSVWDIPSFTNYWLSFVYWCVCYWGCLWPLIKVCLFSRAQEPTVAHLPCQAQQDCGKRAWTQTLSALPGTVNLSYLSHLSHQSERKREGQDKNDIWERTWGKRIKREVPPPWDPSENTTAETPTINPHFLCIVTYAHTNSVSSPYKHALVFSDGILRQRRWPHFPALRFPLLSCRGR